MTQPTQEQLRKWGIELTAYLESLSKEELNKLFKGGADPMGLWQAARAIDAQRIAELEKKLAGQQSHLSDSVGLLEEMYKLLCNRTVQFYGNTGGGIWTWPDRALHCIRPHSTKEFNEMLAAKRKGE